jgi:hypothetical protein
VAHAYNPSYLGGRDWQDHGLRPVRAKSSQDPISTDSQGWWRVPVNSATVGSVKQQDYGPGQPRQKSRPYFKNNQSEKG